MKQINAGVLRVGYEEYGAERKGIPTVLLHGFPYDVHAYTDVARILADQGYWAIVPYLRGYGPTHFLSPDTPRSGQQAALGHDLKALLDALQIQKAVLAGYDWGGRAACIVAALWPERVLGLVTGGGYNIQRIEGAMKPETPEKEYRYWYQYYFHGERGRAGLATYRNEFCHLLWQQWSPNWQFSEAEYAKTATSFANEDFVEVVVHSYRHRFGLADGDPAFEATERRLAEGPLIQVRSLALEGSGDGVTPQGSYNHLDRYFQHDLQRWIIPQIGHNLPQEAPREFADAVMTISGSSSSGK